MKLQRCRNQGLNSAKRHVNEREIEELESMELANVKVNLNSEQEEAHETKVEK